MEEKKSGKLLIIILILFILILIVGIAYLVFQNMELMNKQKQGESQLQTLQNKTQELENQINTNRSVTEENTIEQTQQNTIQSTMTNSITEENVTQQTQQNITTTRKDDQNYVGTYKNSSGEIAIVSKKSDGYYLNFNNNYFKLNMNEKKNDGSIIIYDSKDEFDRWFVYLYPVGVNLKLAENEGDEESSYKMTDSSKTRLLLNGSSQEFLSDVLYKID